MDSLRGPVKAWAIRLAQVHSSYSDVDPVELGYKER